MTNVNEMSDPIDIVDAKERAFSTGKMLQYIGIVLCFLAAIFFIGVATGATMAALEEGHIGEGVLYIGGGAVLGLLFSGVAWLLYKRLPVEPLAPRVRKSRNAILYSFVLGVAIGIVFALLNGSEGGFGLFSNAPLTPVAAAVVIAAWITVAPFFTWIWIKNIDEHEARANNAGAVAGIMTYFMIEPAWWLGWRGGFLPEREGMITLSLVMTVYCTVWLWRRNR